VVVTEVVKHMTDHCDIIRAVENRITAASPQNALCFAAYGPF